MKKLALITVLLIVSLSTQAAETVKEFRGTGNTTTAVFTVEAPWLLDWRLDGDYDTLMKSIRDGMLTLGDDVSVLCGHGPDTTIARERIGNPFLAG